MRNPLCDPARIREIQNKYGFRFSKGLSQNFLIDGEVPARTAAAAALDRGTGVLEIGPGIGALTFELCAAAGKVVALEADPTLPPVLRETLAEFDNVTVLEGDALRADLAALAEEHFSGMRRVVCANLPYHITSEAVEAIIDSGAFSEAVLMVQREAAERICAEPGSRAANEMSCLVSYRCEAGILFDVPPECFLPPPRVRSAVMRLRMRERPPVQPEDEALFFTVIRAAFAQRRKTLVNALAASGALRLDKEAARAAVQAAGLDENVRGERLSLEDFCRIANCIKTRCE